MFVMKQLNIRFADKKNYTKLKRRNTLYYVEHLK